MHYEKTHSCTCTCVDQARSETWYFLQGTAPAPVLWDLAVLCQGKRGTARTGLSGNRSQAEVTCSRSLWRSILWRSMESFAE